MSERDEPTEATRREGPTPARASKPASSEYLERGTLVGRYVVLDRLGEGGMGVVYRAYDPELDRKLAIKLLQAKPGGSSGGGASWLVREAQALARLSHPNVVAVHDVGSLPGDQVFVAMELVDGTTLRQWLRTPRPWREARAVLHAAGQGLAAAHRAGLVHRDFKPENVLVGVDGRVRVMDFGLARLHDDRDASAGEHAAKSPLSDSLTIAGSVVGTPAYMAPEIFRGVPADARTDQFSFGVALYEALYRVRPFEPKALARGEASPPVPPKDSDVPARLERIALRAIALDPSQRFASMDELLGMLAVDPTARKRRVALAAAGALAVVGAIGGAYLLASPRSELCRGAAKRLAGVWDAGVKRAVHDAYVATKLAYAETSFAALAPALDRYASEWTAAATESCEATRVRGDQTEDVLELRSACFDDRLQDLGALTSVLTESNKGAVDQADKMVSGLTPVASCANVAALRDPLRPPPDLASKVRDLAPKVAHVRALMIAGRFLEALTQSTQLRRDVDQLGWKPMMVDLDLMRGLSLAVTGNYTDGADAFVSAAWGAEQVRRDDIVAHSALSLAEIAAQGQGKPGEAQIWLGLGKAANKRFGNDRAIARRTYEVEGIVDAFTGDVAGAITAHEHALAEGHAAFGNDSPHLWEDEHILGTTLTKAGRYVDAIPHMEHALALRERVVGKDHADIALLLSNLAACYSNAHDPRARETFDRALALREKLFGKNSPLLAPTLNNYGMMTMRAGDAKGALPYIERALAMAERFPGKKQYNYHEIATDHADVLISAGRLADARTALDELVPIEEEVKAATLPRTLAIRAELALAEHAWPTAVADAERSLQLYDAASKDNPETWRPRAALGRAQLALGKRDEGRASLEQAIEIAAKLHVDSPQLTATRDALAH
jgi:tetratricopeptide (TPR) repeat protein